MLESPIQAVPLSRAEGKRRSRQKLITATLNSIAKRGFADTTLARVSAGAGLSRGIVNFHFRSKDALFLETLKFMAHEYREHWDRALENAGPTAAERLEAVLMADFDPPICSRNRIAAWFAFYGETQSRPTFLAVCNEMDKVAFRATVDLCRTIIEERDYPNLQPVRVAEGLAAMSEGLWLNLLITPDESKPEFSKEILRTYLKAIFPEHFPITERAAN